MFTCFTERHGTQLIETFSHELVSNGPNELPKSTAHRFTLQLLALIASHRPMADRGIPPLCSLSESTTWVTCKTVISLTALCFSINTTTFFHIHLFSEYE